VHDEESVSSQYATEESEAVHEAGAKKTGARGAMSPWLGAGMHGRWLTVLCFVGAVSGCSRPSSPPSPEALQYAADQYNPDRLLDALDRLEAWQAKSRPELAKQLGKGLSKVEIEARIKTKAVPCVLADEVVELYQWHDGTSIMDAALTPDTDFVWHHAFLSLDNALAAWETNQRTKKWPKNWFPLFAYDHEHYFIVCEPEARPATPIYFKDDVEPDRILAFTNLTTMIETTVAWFESGATVYPPDPTEEELRAKARRRSEIHRAVNPIGEYPYPIR
jgi:hypothetical protein